MRRDRQREGRTLWIELHNFGTPLQMRCTSTEDLRNFCSSYRQWSRYYITVYQVDTATHAVLWLSQKFWFRSRFQIPSLKSIIPNLISALSSNTSYHVTTTAFLTHSIYYKLQIAQWSDECSVHKIDPEIHFKCGLHVTVKQRAACVMLTHISSRIRTICVHAVSVMSVPLSNNI